MNRMLHSRTRFALSGLVLGAILAGGCASGPPPVHSMKDPNANFGSYSNFAWDAGQQNPGQAVSILDGNIRAAITSELQKKGYVQWEGTAKPDLLLRYETGAAEKVKANPFRIGVGVGGYGSSGGASVGMSSPAAKNVTEGSLILSVIDTNRNTEVWNGRVSRELGKEGPDPELINSAVSELLSEFPSKSGALQ